MAIKKKLSLSINFLKSTLNFFIFFFYLNFILFYFFFYIFLFLVLFFFVFLNMTDVHKVGPYVIGNTLGAGVTGNYSSYKTNKRMINELFYIFIFFFCCSF